MHVFVKQNNRLFPPTGKLKYIRDVSVTKPADLGDDELSSVVCGFFVKEFESVCECFVIDKFTAANGREDRGLRFVIEGFLSRKEANDIDLEIRRVLREKFSMH